jgi:hypothetical protein
MTLVRTAPIIVLLVALPLRSAAQEPAWRAARRWGADPAAAQPPPQTPDVAVRRERMRTFLVLRIADALHLPDDKALQISKILRDAEDRRQTLVAQRREVERNLHGALDGQGKTDQAALGKLIAQANDIDNQIALIPEASFRQVQDLLTVDQQARLVLLRPELQNQIRQNVERRLQRMRMGP